MKYSRQLLPSLCLLALGSCTTMKAVDETKKNIDEGDYGWAVYNGTMGVAIAAIYDVVTLGGTSDPETTVQTAISVANSQQSTAPQTSGSVANSDQNTVNTISNSTENAPNNGANSQPITVATLPSSSILQQPAPQSGASTSSNNTSSTEKQSQRTPAQNACITFDRQSNSLADFIFNNCQSQVWVNWFDEKYCKTGCGDGPLQPGSKNSIHKTTGEIKFAACSAPALPRNPDGSLPWRGGTFMCIKT